MIVVKTYSKAPVYLKYSTVPLYSTGTGVTTRGGLTYLSYLRPRPACWQSRSLERTVLTLQLPVRRRRKAEEIFRKILTTSIYIAIVLLS